MANATTAVSAEAPLQWTLITIATAYVALGGALMWLQGASAGAFGRIVVVLGLCLLTARGANWARLLLGAFVVPISILLFVRLGTAESFGWYQWLLAACILVVLGGYLALFFHRATAAEFARRRKSRTGHPPAAT